MCCRCLHRSSIDSFARLKISAKIIYFHRFICIVLNRCHQPTKTLTLRPHLSAIGSPFVISPPPFAWLSIYVYAYTNLIDRLFRFVDKKPSPCTCPSGKPHMAFCRSHTQTHTRAHMNTRACEHARAKLSPLSTPLCLHLIYSGIMRNEKNIVLIYSVSIG